LFAGAGHFAEATDYIDRGLKISPDYIPLLKTAPERPERGMVWQELVSRSRCGAFFLGRSPLRANQRLNLATNGSTASPNTPTKDNPIPKELSKKLEEDYKVATKDPKDEHEATRPTLAVVNTELTQTKVRALKGQRDF